MSMSRQVPIRCLGFGLQKDPAGQRVFMFDGHYLADRNLARLALNSGVWRGYSYFAKIELVFQQDHVQAGS